MLDLDDDALIAIGSVSAQWAALEYYMSRVTHSCCIKHGNSPSKGIGSMAFIERRAAFVEAFHWENVANDTRQRALDLADRISAAENKRHTIIHGMANEFSDDGGEELSCADREKIIMFLRDHPKHYFAEQLTVSQITAIRDEIASINVDMVALYVSLWLSHDP